jgi:pantoate--beta-alanine ligase
MGQFCSLIPQTSANFTAKSPGMHVVHHIAELRTALRPFWAAGGVGLVPTMGALHEGHLSLVRASRAQNGATVCSIFVNPAQFNNRADLTHYPRTLEADLAMLAGEGCDLVFAPSEAEMYPGPPTLRLDFGPLEQVLEGLHRPGHFAGVGLVVAKLFNLVRPDRAYFGQKDLQQCQVVARLVADLSWPVELHRCPTVREPDGLAMSSRNRRLLPAERAHAPRLYAALGQVREAVLAGATVAQAKADALAYLNSLGGFNVEYLEVAETSTLQPVEALLPGEEYAVLVAAHLGQVRLIDNLIF